MRFLSHMRLREVWDGSTSQAALKENIRGNFEKKITGFFMGTFLYKIVNVHLTFIQLFSSAFFNVDVEFFFFNGCMAFSCWMFVSIYMHFILAINRAAINIFVLAFNPLYFVFFFLETYSQK